VVCKVYSVTICRFLVVILSSQMPLLHKLTFDFGCAQSCSTVLGFQQLAKHCCLMCAALQQGWAGGRLHHEGGQQASCHQASCQAGGLWGRCQAHWPGPCCPALPLQVSTDSRSQLILSSLPQAATPVLEHTFYMLPCRLYYAHVCVRNDLVHLSLSVYVFKSGNMYQQI